METDKFAGLNIRPKTPEEITMEEEAAANMPQIMQEFGQLHRRLKADFLKRYDSNGGNPFRRLTSSLDGSSLPLISGKGKLPFRLG